MVVQAGLWATSSLIHFLKSRKLRLAMYGKRGVGEGACAILAMWGEIGDVVVGSGVSTNNAPIKETSIKEAI